MPAFWGLLKLIDTFWQNPFTLLKSNILALAQEILCILDTDFTEFRKQRKILYYKIIFGGILHGAYLTLHEENEG